MIATETAGLRHTAYWQRRHKWDKQRRPNLDWSRYPMTVCLAAICTLNGQEAVIGASDCMLTYENIEFEPALQDAQIE
jgi:hypothetical protein